MKKNILSHKLYDPAKVPLLPAFMPLHPFDNGEMTVRDEKLALWPRTPEDTRQQLADYYACAYELNNLAAKPEHAAKLAEMTALLEKEMVRCGDTAPLKVTDPRSAAWTPPAQTRTKKGSP